MPSPETSAGNLAGQPATDSPAARPAARARRLQAIVLVAASRPADQAAWRLAVGEGFAALETGNLAGARALLQALRPAVAMLDFALLGMQGAASLPALRRLSPDTRFIVLGEFASDDEEMAIFKAGARACCDPGIATDLLARAIDAVLRGESNKRIAQQLSITERTVKAHLTEVFRKAGVDDRVKLALLISGSAAH